MIYRKKFSYFGWREEQAIENSVARFVGYFSTSIGKIFRVTGTLLWVKDLAKLLE